jgi:glycogen(starch) synthase
MKKKVLMLGWEFPPIINGGLGVACLGIAKSLSNYVDLTVILPKTDPEFVVDNVKLIGLNNIELKTLLRNDKVEKSSSIEKTSYESFADVEYVNINFDPYYHTFSRDAWTEQEHRVVEHEVLEEERLTKEALVIEEFLASFGKGDIYGKDVIQKVKLFARYVLKMVADKDFDIVYAHDWMTFLAGIELKFKTGKPLALHVHALDFDRGGPDCRGWIFDLEKYAMEHADVIIPVSHYTGDIIAGHYQIDKRKIYPVHNGVDFVEAYCEKKAFPEQLVVFLGRVTGQKGPEFFLEVASKVFEQYKKVRFVVAGTGDRLKRLIETGAYRQIGHKFHFTGFLTKEKVHRLLAMADVYCMPSVSEPFGLSALEAAQFGVPMVISKQSGAAEVLNGALKADYWDVDLMAQHITDLLKSKRLGNKVVKQGYEDLKTLSWDHSANQILRAFDSVLATDPVSAS